MQTLYHGSNCRFEQFDLSKAGEGTGIKFGFGVYLTEAIASAVHYSQPRKMVQANEHYLYTVEVENITEDNHIFSVRAVAPSIVKRTQAHIGVKVPEDIAANGKLFRKWVGCQLTHAKKPDFASEKAAAEFFDFIGVYYYIWPTAQTKPEGLRNVAVFNSKRARIVKVELIDNNPELCMYMK